MGRRLLEQALQSNVPGDFLEAGSWRGGVSMYAQAVLKASGVRGSGRGVYVCDSFNGFPDPSWSFDKSDWREMSMFNVSVEEVRTYFQRFRLLDPNVHFFEGFFRTTMPQIRNKFAVEGRRFVMIHADGDMLESYFDILFNLYDYLPIGGFLICDDCPEVNT